MKNILYTFLAVVFALLCSGCGLSSSGSALLTGAARFKDPVPDFSVRYLPENNVYLEQVIDLQVDTTGHYTFSTDLPDGVADVEIRVGNDVFGAHLEKGKTTQIDFIQEADGKVTATYGGDNADVSEAVGAAAVAYDFSSLQDMRYAKAKALADSRHQAAKEKAREIQDETLRDYYMRLDEARYTGIRLRLLGKRALNENLPESDNLEYAELLATIDPNSDIDYVAMNSILWMINQPKSQPAAKGDYSGYCIELMNLADSLITHPRFYKQLAYAIPQTFFSNGDHESGKEAFWTRYQTFAKDYPEYIEAFESEYEKVVVDMNGKKLPELTLTRPDGSNISSLSLMGHFTYVDVWASWCGPCCEEIPFLKQLVEKMKGNRQLQFVSFSVDTDRDEWLKKLEADKPQWTQFHLNGASQKTLCDVLGITDIPRFFILAPDGTVHDQDAKRPSDPELLQQLHDLTK